MFERYYSCSIIAYCRYVMFQKRILSKPKWGGQGPLGHLVATGLELGLQVLTKFVRS